MNPIGPAGSTRSTVALTPSAGTPTTVVRDDPSEAVVGTRRADGFVLVIEQMLNVKP